MKNRMYLVLAVFSAVVICRFATLFAKAPENFTPEQRRRLVEVNRRVYGGFVTKPDPGNGHLAVVNLQKRVSEKEVRHAARYVGRISSLPIEYYSKPDPKAAVTVYVRDDAAQPSSLLVSPGEFWAQVNIAALASDAPSDAVLAARTRKEVVRAFAYACGAAGSQYPDTLVGPVRSLRQLDRFPDEGLPPDVFMRMEVFVRAMGVRPLHRTSYAAACEEGWAPAPTNEYQRVIWERIRSEKERGPSNALRIVPKAK